MNINFFKRINDLIIFQQRFQTNPQRIYQKICEVSNRMENTENINQNFRDKNYELTSTNEILNTNIQTQNTTIQILKQKFLIKKTS